MNTKVVLLLLPFFFLSLSVSSQEIVFVAKDKPLNQLLLELREEYNISFSFDDDALSKYNISINGSYDNIEAALDAVLKDLPLAYMKSEEVFVIFPKDTRPKPKPPKRVFTLTGSILERNSGEVLPFTNVIINGNGMSADEQGRLLYKSARDSVFQVLISHLGYYLMDTLLTAGKHHQLALIPAREQFEEVVIREQLLENFVYTDYEAGVVKLNHNITRFLPGSSDNSVFNLLRLQSGILAAAEQSTELMIWGSYEGQSRILFDDFVLFGLRNFNDNISAVNPFIVKNIKLMKAGFDAEYGNCVGGIAQITGKDGYQNKTKLDVSLNNYTVNALLQLPIGEQSSFILGFRHTYFNLYDNKDVGLFKNLKTPKASELTIEPDYSFRDVNMKYAWRNEQGLYLNASFLGGKDDFRYTVEEEILRRDLTKKTNEENQQTGAALRMGKTFSGGYNTDLKFSYSGLETGFKDAWQIAFPSSGNIIREYLLEVDNYTEELSLAWQNEWRMNEHHQFSGNVEYTLNKSSWVEDSMQVNIVDQQLRGSHYSLIFQDRMTWGSLNFQAGLRINYLPYLDKINLEPRLHLSKQLGEVISLKAAFGIYRQFVAKSSVVDNYNNYRYMWVVADGETYPVLKAYHWVGGLAFDFNTTNISLEPYYKATEGLTRYINHRFWGYETIYQGKGRSYGVDFYLKQEINKHTAWVSYTLSKTEEHFDFFPDEDYRVAPHDQRHELKLAAMIDLDPVYFSANYVYGSGFPIYISGTNPAEYERTAYNRFDAALVYKFSAKWVFGEAGLSVLNVFNTENVLYSNLERVPTDQTASIEIYSQSVPFTPTLYLKLGF